MISASTTSSSCEARAGSSYGLLSRYSFPIHIPRRLPSMVILIVLANGLVVGAGYRPAKKRRGPLRVRLALSSVPAKELLTGDPISTSQLRPTGRARAEYYLRRDSATVLSGRSPMKTCLFNRRINVSRATPPMKSRTSSGRSWSCVHVTHTRTRRNYAGAGGFATKGRRLTPRSRRVTSIGLRTSIARRKLYA